MPAPLVTAALIGAGANLLGGLFGSNSAKQANRAAASEAQKNRDFQERLSNTSHQREVDDLRAAGLNPILSAHGGASSPSGGIAPVMNTGEPLRDSIKHSATALSEALVNRETIATMKTQQELNKANAAKSITEAAFIGRGRVSIPGFYSGYLSDNPTMARYFNSAKSVVTGSAFNKPKFVNSTPKG